MKVILKKEAVFEFNDGKYTAIPREVFTTLVGEPHLHEEYPDEEMTPMVEVFENKEDYINNAGLYDIDKDKSVYVSSKGQIFCFLKNDSTHIKENQG